MCSCVACLFFFFFKQKTAYDMRISDWSSDVCSSDLTRIGAAGVADRFLGQREFAEHLRPQPDDRGHAALPHGERVAEPLKLRSEEHTSELQSLMRISYAVFCLKKKKYKY